MNPANAAWISIMTGVVWGLALGEVSRSWWFGLRVGAAAFGIVTIGPLLLVTFLAHSKPTAQEAADFFIGSMYAANALFWGWALWTTGRAKRPTA